jgi:hypothetical protein
MAPEYATRGQLTDKADVYSFGVLMLEVISGRKNIDFSAAPPERVYLLEWVSVVWKSRSDVSAFLEAALPGAFYQGCEC